MNSSENSANSSDSEAILADVTILPGSMLNVRKIIFHFMSAMSSSDDTRAFYGGSTEDVFQVARKTSFTTETQRKCREIHYHCRTKRLCESSSGLV